MSGDQPFTHLTIGMLGLVTICAYGTWYYSFGVLLDPILIDTGWSETTLAASYSMGTVLTGVGSMLGGHLLDRLGTRPVFLTAAIIGGTAFGVVSIAGNIAVFAGASAIGMAVFGALGFYHITMTAAVRSSPSDPIRAIAVLTVWGAFASAIYLPAVAWLVESMGWRPTVRILAVAAAAIFAAAALTVPVAAEEQASARPSLRSIAARTITGRDPRAFTASTAMAGLAISTLLVYQVPLMVAAGLSLTTAATMAAVRGLAQLGGRLPLTPLVRSIGARAALMTSFAALGVGALILTASGSVPVALVFAAVAGFGLGAYSPLQGIYADELFDRSTLGATMGVYATVLLVAGAVGPVVAGAIADSTGERRWAAVLIASACVVGIVMLARGPDRSTVDP